MRAALALVLVAGCVKNPYQTHTAEGASFGLLWVETGGPAPVGLREPFHAGVLRRLENPELTVRLDPFEPAGPSGTVEVALASGTTWAGEGYHVRSLDIAVRVRDAGGATLWRFELPCAGKGILEELRPQEYLVVPEAIDRAAERARRGRPLPVWRDRDNPWATLAERCGFDLVDRLNGRTGDEFL